MATSVQSNPIYYSLASLTSSRNGPTRTVVLHKRPDHNGFGVYIGEDVPKGLYVVTVEINSPAADAKIQPGDRVLAVNGQLVSAMTTNPKEVLTRAATNAENLTLTIESTNIFETLNIPLTNSYNNDTNNNNHSNRSSQRDLSKRNLDINSDLESYIKSLFANEDIQIMSTSLNNNEYILTSDPNAKSSTHFNSSQPHQHRSSDHQREHHHRHRRHHPHHRSKQAFRDTKDTQTSLDNDQDENTEKLSPTRQYPSQPSMGTSQRILRNLPSNPNDNGTNDSQEYKPSSTNKSSEFGATSRSPTPPYDSSGYSTTNRPALPVTTSKVFAAAAPSPTPNNANHNLKNNTHPPSQHMIDVVDAAVVASRNREQANNREQNPSHSPAPVTKRTTTPPPSQNSRESTTRHPAPVTTRTTTPPPPPQNPRDGPARHPAPTSTQSTAPPAPPNSRDNNARGPAPDTTQAAGAPPPYTAAAPVDNRASTNEGTYNVRDAQQGQPQAAVNEAVDTTSSAPRGEGLHEVHLQRSPNFQGFGFHLQYNKSYYLVHRIEADSPAAAGDLRTNDVIHTINNQMTENMVHADFVQIVSASSKVDFVVQSVDEYLRAHPQPPRNQQVATSVAAAISGENDKRKSGISRALNKLTSR